MSSENRPIRKAWIRHARSLTLRKWLLAALGVALIAWAAATVIHHRAPTKTAATSPAAEAPKAAAKTAAPPVQSASKAAPSAASKTAPPAGTAATAPPAGTSASNAAPPPLRSMPAGESALILAAPLAPSPPVQLPPQAPTAAAASPSTPAALPVPELPTVAVASPGFHVVPSDRDTKRLGAVTMSERNGHTFTIVPAAPAPHSAQPAVATAVPPRPDGFAPVVANPAVFSSHARATGPLTLEVQGQTVELFGVKPVESPDRCAAANGKPVSCAVLAQAALAHKLAGHSIVACRVPPGQRGTLGAICLDEQGNDLGRFLVIEGLALADSAQSYDYLPAEGAARSAKRGLWRFR